MKSLPLATAAMLLAGPLHAQPAQVPISAFVKENQFSQPRMSPDGKHLAVTVRMQANERTVPVVTFYSLPDLKIESMVRMPIYQVPLDYHWVSNTRLVIRKGHEQGSREAPVSYGEVLAMDYDGKNQDYLYGYDMAKNNRNSRYGADYGAANIARLPYVLNNTVLLGVHTWGAKDSTLYEVHTKTGYRKTIASVSQIGFSFAVQNDGKARFAMGSLEDSRGAIFRFDDASKEWKQLDPAVAGASFRPFAFSADDSEFMAWHSAKGEPDSIVRENLQSGARRTIASDQESALTTPMYGAARDMPIAVSTVVGIPQMRFLQDESHPDIVLYKQLSQQFPGAQLRFVDFTDDGNTLLFSVHSDRDPGAYYLFDRKTYRADVLFIAKEEIQPEQMAERRPFSYSARDGLRIHGYITLPKNAAAGSKLPMVLLPHGGPHGIYDDWYFDTDAQFLANRGYAVLQVNYRGSGSRGPGFKAIGYRQWHDKIMDDLADAVKAAVATAGIDKDRVCIFGASFGGYAAMTAASRYPDMFKCAVGYAGAYDLKLFFEANGTREEKKRESFFRRYLSDDITELNRISPAMHADRIKVPVLLIHGGQDKVTPEEHGFRMKKALETAGNAPEWYYVASEGHGFYATANQTEVYRRLEAFLAKHIGK